MLNNCLSNQWVLLNLYLLLKLILSIAFLIIDQYTFNYPCSENLHGSIFYCWTLIINLTFVSVLSNPQLCFFESRSCSVVSNSLQPHGLYSSWNSPGQNTGVSSCSLLQGIFPTQGSNPGLPHCRQILYQLSHQGSPRILEWAAMPSSRGSSWPRDPTQVSHIAGRFYTVWVL